MQLTHRDAVPHGRDALLLAVRDDVRRIEQLLVPEATQRALASVGL